MLVIHNENASLNKHAEAYLGMQNNALLKIVQYLYKRIYNLTYRADYGYHYCPQLAVKRSIENHSAASAPAT